MSESWKQLCAVAATALAVIVGADIALARLAPPRQLREVQDGVADLRSKNPDTLVLGSSHARTLHVLGGELERRTGGAQTLVAVPLENGKLVAYDWLLKNKLEPLEDATDGDGHPAKSRLRRLVLITEWWDSCPRDHDSPYWNLPARAWTFDDFLADVARDGINGFNRNYLQNRLRRIFSGSSLVYDRTQQVLVKYLVQAARHQPLGPTPEEVALTTTQWQAMVEHGANCIGDAKQMQALADISEFAAARHLEMTILLFPRKPATLNERSRQTTLPQFAALVRGFAAPRGIRVVDLTTTAPVGDEDFMEDFDHINAVGNKKFASWALEHDLGFLLQPAPPPVSSMAQGNGP